MLAPRANRCCAIHQAADYRMGYQVWIVLLRHIVFIGNHHIGWLALRIVDDLYGSRFARHVF